MKTLQIILLSFISLTGCARNRDTAKTTSAIASKNIDTAAMTNSDGLTYLALGDSYTIGQSVPANESYPQQLTNALNSSFSANGSKSHVQDPKIIAVTGWTTDNLINAIAQSGLGNKKFSFVTLLIGVNDQYQGISIENYQVKFAQVLNTAISFANGDVSKVFVISIPDYGVTPFAAGQDAVIGPQIDLFNSVNKSISEKAGVNYLNITDISKQAKTDLSLVADDGLHPSGSMYALWVKRLEPLVFGKVKN